MTLDIIIPHYKESEKVIYPLLDSINLQQLVDFKLINIIIVNDGNDVILSDSFFKQFSNLTIKYFIKSHGGVAAARNFGVKKSTSDFIMFCDADDMFISLVALFGIFAEIERHPDTLIVKSNFLVEAPESETSSKLGIIDAMAPGYSRYFVDLFIHGKLFKRKFLIDCNIIFPEKIKVGEDKAFVNICYAHLEDASQLLVVNSPFYLWKHNENSVTRSVTYTEKTKHIRAELFFCEQTIESAICEIQEMQKFKDQEYLSVRTFSFIYSVYLLLVGYPAKIDDEVVKLIQKASIMMAQHFNFFNDLSKNINTTNRIKVTEALISDQTIQIGFNRKAIEKLSFDNWWKRIEKLNKQLKELK